MWLFCILELSLLAIAMYKILKISLIAGILISIYSCATSMTPAEVHGNLPAMTKSKFLTQAQAVEATKNDECKYLNRGRSYLAPVGFTAKNDLQNGAKGIDEWVQLDGGNAYVLTNYRWLTVDTHGDTQLFVEFDTLKCE